MTRIIFHHNYPLIVTLKDGLVVMKEENKESERARKKIGQMIKYYI
jgi:hypothetical protein